MNRRLANLLPNLFRMRRRNRLKKEIVRPLTETLLAMCRQGPIESAIGILCEQQGLARTQNCAEWKYLFPVVEGERVLELGAGIGEDTLSLYSEAPEVVAVVPSAANAELLNIRLREHRVANTQVVILHHVTKMPWEDASFGGIAMEDAAAAGFNLCRKPFPEFAEECRRLLRPGGCVCLGIRNDPHHFRILNALISKLHATRHPESLNRMIKREGHPQTEALHLGCVTRAMRAAGFESPQLFAPMPDEKQTKAVIPLNAPEPFYYYLDHLVRRDTVAIRTAVRLMKGLIRIGMARRVLPYYIVVFRLRNNLTTLPNGVNGLWIF